MRNPLVAFVRILNGIEDLFFSFCANNNFPSLLNINLHNLYVTTSVSGRVQTRVLVTTRWHLTSAHFASKDGKRQELGRFRGNTAFIIALNRRCVCRSQKEAPLDATATGVADVVCTVNAWRTGVSLFAVVAPLSGHLRSASYFSVAAYHARLPPLFLLVFPEPSFCPPRFDLQLPAPSLGTPLLHRSRHVHLSSIIQFHPLFSSFDNLQLQAPQFRLLSSTCSGRSGFYFLQGKKQFCEIFQISQRVADANLKINVSKRNNYYSLSSE